MLSDLEVPDEALSVGGLEAMYTPLSEREGLVDCQGHRFGRLGGMGCRLVRRLCNGHRLVETSVRQLVLVEGVL